VIYTGVLGYSLSATDAIAHTLFADYTEEQAKRFARYVNRLDGQPKWKYNHDQWRSPGVWIATSGHMGMPSRWMQMTGEPHPLPNGYRMNEAQEDDITPDEVMQHYSYA